MQPIDAGTLLAGKYRLEALIGRGGMGSVWRAEHLGLTAPVAVKLLELHDYGGTGEALARFHREAHAAAAIRSPHVVQILDHGIDQHLGAPFIVMELMEGESLAGRLERQGRISPAETARVMTHVARALSRAHEAGIVHRDLKPDNVFLVRNEDEEVAKVLDFGIAKAQTHALAGDSGTRTGAVMGTAYYMSPEQISGQKSVDLRTDLWALGVMTYECLLGARPFDADTIGGLTLKICIEPLPVPSQRGPVPAGFDEWFARCVHRDPAQRFGSAREAAEALRLVCSVTASPPSSHLAPTLAAAPAVSSPSGPSSGAVAANTGAPVSHSSVSTVRGDAPAKSPSPWPWLALAGVIFTGAAAGAALWWKGKTEQASAEPALTASSAPVAPEPSPAAPPEVLPASAPAASSDSAPSAPVTASTNTPAPAASVTPQAPPGVAAPAKTVKKPPVFLKPAQPTATANTPRPTATVAKPKPTVVRDVIDDRH